MELSDVVDGLPASVVDRLIAEQRARATSGSSDRSLEPTGRRDGAYPDVVTETLVPERDIVSWSDLEVLVRRLAERIRTTDVDVMLASPGAGWCPPGCWPIAWGIRNILVAAVEYYDDHGQPGPSPTFFQFPADPLLRGQRVLIVDEVWDSGTTIVAVAERVRQAGGDPRTAVLHYKPERSQVDAVFPTSTSATTDAGSSTRSSSGTDDSPGPPGVAGATDGQHGARPLLVLRHERRRLGPTLEVELREDRAHVVLDRLVGQEDLGGDLLVRLALGDQHQDLPLLGGQLGELIVRPAGGDATHALEHLLRDGRIEQRLAATDRLERGDEVSRADLLEEVPGRAGDDRREHGLLVGVRGEHDHARLGQLGTDLATRLDARPIGQADVHDDDVRLVAPGLLDRLRDGAGLGDDLEAVAPVEEGDKALADDLVIVDDEQAERSGGDGFVRIGQSEWLLSVVGTRTMIRVATTGRAVDLERAAECRDPARACC